jgi:N-acetylmuramoyl-L-alanine amidase
MGISGAKPGWSGRGFCCVGLVWVSVGLAWGSTRTETARKPVTLTPFQQAERERVEFEALPESSKTKAAFAQVMDGFREVYHDNPRDTHAPEAVNAVAELLAEQGRTLGDAKTLRAAVGQYEFLRTQYPGSGLRVSALLAEATIEEEDLEDGAVAREKYAAVVKEAPRSGSAGEARAKLAELGQVARGHGLVVSAGKEADSSASLRNDNKSALRNDNKEGADNKLVAEVPIAAPKRGPLALVTGIRHWSTPTYTRVAIDLGSEVTFEAARVPNPDRIYFDLHGTRLGAELVGKSFDVTDDGYLKKIRAAQASGDVTRVVLDVSDVSEYSAFLLPNPYRLIVDIHGGNGAVAPKVELAASSTPVDAGAGKKASAAANASGLPAMAVTDGGEAVRPVTPVQTPTQAWASGRAQPLDNLASGPVKAGHTGSVAAPRTGVSTKATETKPVPNTVAVKAPVTTMEVAAVSSAPGKVEATSAPTSRPIAAVVKAGRAPLEMRAKDDRPVAKMGRSTSAAVPTKAAEKTADGETSLVRALGLKIGRIVIDAGHGGHDSGTLGVDGIQEKDVVLDVALRLGKLLHERLGAEIIYTRSDDTFIPLETRTAIANKAQADLFLSIHANSSQDVTARGVETYYLNFTSDSNALDVAARENAVGGQSIHQLSDLVKKITLKDKIAESREFASDVEGSLFSGLQRGNAGLKNRGVKKAPFVVLIGANMPSILAEISFVTNARDAEQLRTPEYRQRVAESLFTGVAKYEGGLAGARPVQMAEK